MSKSIGGLFLFVNGYLDIWQTWISGRHEYLADLSSTSFFTMFYNRMHSSYENL